MITYATAGEDSPIRFGPSEKPPCPGCGEVVTRIVAPEGTTHARCERCGQHMLIVGEPDEGWCATAPLSAAEMTFVLRQLEHKRTVKQALRRHIHGYSAAAA